MGVYYKTRKDGTRVWYYDLCVDGKRRRGIGGDSKREALNTLAEVRSKYRKGELNPFVKAKDPLFEEFAEKFLTWSRTNKRSAHRDQQFVENLSRYLGGRRLSAIDSEDVEEYKIRRKAERARNNRVQNLERLVSNATVNRELACLKRMYSLAMKWKDARHNPVTGVQFLEEPVKQERYIDKEEFARLYEAACPSIKPVLLVAYHTGMRLEEYLSLKWNQVTLFDPPKKVVGMDGAENYGYIQVFHTKSGKPREIPLNRTLWHCLKELRLSQISANDYVLKASHGGRFKSITDQFRIALRKSGIEPARLHDLRGSWATRLNEAGVDAYKIMRIGGWSSLKMLERYLRRNQRDFILAMQTLDEVPPHCHQEQNETKKRKTKAA
jgi:integrase